MPIVSRFFGITIAFYWEEHLPPHFHAKYSGDEGMIDIRTGTVIRGSLPKRVLSLVDEWRVARIDELLADWEPRSSATAAGLHCAAGVRQ